MHELDFFQSMWAMELRRPDGFEWTVEEKFERIANAGYKGVCFDLGPQDMAFVEQCRPCIEAHDLDVIFNAFPATDDDYRRFVDFAGTLGERLRFISIIGKVVPWSVREVAAVTRRWLAIGAAGGVTTYVEIHRNCMTNDLLFTLQLMEEIPELMMCADLSHALVNQEWYLPLPPEADEFISRFLERSETFQGRIATREQIQIAVEFEQHREWVQLSQSWWREGFVSWRRRHADETNARCVFLCELGPPPYGITGADGYELVDRWDDALRIRAMAQTLWTQTAPAAGPAS